MKLIIKNILYSLIFISPLSVLASEQYEQSESNTSYVPRAYLSGYIGTEALGEGDLLIPLFTTDDKALILYSQARYIPESKDESWSAGSGLLYRFVAPYINGILGLYVLGDYNQITSGQEYIDINPGVEILGSVWDFHINGYIPIGKKNWSQEMWAKDFFGNPSYLRQTGNSEYDHKILQYTETGLGSDIEIGKKLFKIKNLAVKVYAQGYYFNMDRHSNVVGGGLKIKVDATEQLSLIANYTYDNYQHNVFITGIQLKLNGLFNKSKNSESENIAYRLFDRIDRSYANLSTGTRTLVTKGYKDVGEYFKTPIVVVDPINPGDPTYEKGTWQNPYDQSDIDKSGLQSILDATHQRFPKEIKIYFAPGEYNGSLDKPLNLYQGISIAVKAGSYQKIIQSIDEVLFIGAMNLLGDNELEGVSLQNIDISGGYKPFEVGLDILNNSHVVLRNIKIGTPESRNYLVGIRLDNSKAIISNSNIYNYQTSENVSATGIRMQNGSILYAHKTNIEVKASSGNAYGIYADGKQDILKLDNSIVNVQSCGNADYLGNGYGILVDGNEVGKNTVIVSNSTIKGDGSSSNGKFSGNGYGIYSKGNGGEIMVQEKSSVSGTGKGMGDFSGNGYGVFVGQNYYNAYEIGSSSNTVNDNTIKLLNSTVEGTGNSNSGKFAGSGYGLLVGHDYQYIDQNHTNQENINSGVHNNTITISNSILTGTGNNNLDATFSGNGYGVIVGSGAIYIEKPDNSWWGNGSTDAFDITSTIFNNNISISRSNLSSTGINKNNAPYFSGNSYGLLIGNGLFWGNVDDSFSSQIDLSIRNNIAVVTNSNLQAYSDCAFYIKDQLFKERLSGGNNFGILVGYDSWYYKEKGNIKIISEIATNDMKINDSKVMVNFEEKTITSADGNSYGVVMGCEDGNITAKSDNKLTISNSSINFILKDDDYRNAYGIITGGELNIDDYTTSNIGRNDNQKRGKKVNSNNISLEW